MFNLFDPFEVNKQDIEQLFEASATTVLVNDVPTKAIITLDQLVKSSEDRNIHTLSKIATGDLITYQDEKYLIINETVTKRHNKYKTIMRHCNHTITIGRTSIPAVVSTDQSFRLNESFSFVVDETSLTFTVQDTQKHRDALERDLEFEFLDSNWKLTNKNYTQKGIIVVTCDRTFESTR